MTLDLVVMLFCSALVIGYAIGISRRDKDNEQLRELDENHIKALTDLIKRHVGRREDDYHNIG